MAFTERVRDDTSLQLPLFLRSSRFHFLKASGTVVKPVLFSAFLHVASLTLTDIRPANIEESLLRPSSFQRKSSWSHYDAFRSNPPSFFKQELASPGSIHVPSFNSSYPCFAAHFFQYTDRALGTSIFFNVSWAHTHTPHVNSCLIHLMPMSRVSHITALFNCLVHTSFVMTPFSGPNSFCPVLSGQGEIVPSLLPSRILP